jgi:Kef-type K+ transport system membrane component KefB
MDIAFDKVFYEIAVLVLLGAALGLLGLLARQPLVVAFIAAGVLAGPDALGLVASTEFVETLSQISIAVLLFLVGLKLDLTLVRRLGRVAIATGLGQVLFTAFFGFLICLALGITWLPALYIAVALTFSSTIIIVKLLSDKREIDALHGKIALGFLIVQDIFVVLAMVALSAIGMGASAEGSATAEFARLIGGAVAMLAAVAVFIRYLATPLLGLIARSPELMVIFAVGWAAGLAAAGDAIGFGKELGGLLAGVSLASTPFRDAIGARLASLRDFLLLFFFLGLGAALDLSGLGAQIGPAIILSLFVLIGNPLIVMVIIGLLGYRKRTGFLAGLTVAQISEFSLIFMAMGVSIGHVGEEAIGLVTLVGLVTIALSVYMITWSHQIYDRIEPWLGVFERKGPRREDVDDAGAAPAAEVILFGLGRYGQSIARGLREAGFRVIGVDFDPAALADWRRAGFDGRFGDATDPEFVAHLPLSGARVVVSAVPRTEAPLTVSDPQLALLHGLRSAGFGGTIALAASDRARIPEGPDFAGVLWLTPFDDAASFAVERLSDILAPVRKAG